MDIFLSSLLFGFAFFFIIMILLNLRQVENLESGLPFYFTLAILTIINCATENGFVNHMINTITKTFGG